MRISDWSSDVCSSDLLVAWGESLFLSGVASAQSQADATKAFIPGTEIKDILLPTNQIAFNAAVNNDITLLGYYKLDFRPNEIFPVGDYFSPADVVGPRSEEHTSELQSLMRISYAAFCWKKKSDRHSSDL